MQSKVIYMFLIMAFISLIGCKKELSGEMSMREAFDEPQLVTFMEFVVAGQSDKADTILPNIDVNRVGNKGVTPLFWLISVSNGKDLTAIKYLLKSGAFPNYIDPITQVSAMYLASGGDNPIFLELLIKHGGDVNQIIKQSKSMLMVAASQGRLDNINILLSNGANLSWYNKFEESAASSALIQGNFDLTVYLLERGYNSKLQTLASYVEARVANEEQQPFKEKAIDILIDRGATFPASGRLIRYIENNTVADDKILNLVYGREIY